MDLRWLGICFASTVALGTQSALAQPVTKCGPEQALQSFDTSGRGVTCINVPDGAALQGQINTELTARAAADMQLQGQVNAEVSARVASDTQLQNNINGAQATLLDAVGQERSARIAADDELRASIGGGGAETGIAGVYAVSGSQECTNASRGFTENLQPIIAVTPPWDPTPLPDGTIPPPPAPVITTVNVSSSKVTGFQTFNPDQTGSVDLIFHTVSHPGHIFGTLGTGGPGGGTVTHITGSFIWSVTPDGKLVFDGSGLAGRVVKGASPNSIIRTSGSPRFIGVLGKDRRIIAAFQEGMAMELQSFFTPEDVPQFSQNRVCIRERLLRRM